jgi:hypothetical protein
MATDAQLEKRIRRAERRLKQVRRKGATARISRLERRATRLRALLAMPADQRPRSVLNLDVLKTALDAASVLLAATPAGPVLAVVKGGLAAAKGVGKALASADVGDAMDEVVGLVRAELERRGVRLDEDDDVLLSLTDALENELEPELAG